MADDIVTRLRKIADLQDMDDDNRAESPFLREVADEIERLRAALALACGLLSTYEDHSMFHPEALVLQFMEEARRG